jgi:putative transposase
MLDSSTKTEEHREEGTVSQQQIVAILHQAEPGDQSVAEICREHGITETTFYRWRRAYGGMSVPEAQRLKELERENARLKRLLAERDLAIDALQEYLAKK